MTLDGLGDSGAVAGTAASGVGWSFSEGCAVLFLGWMVIIGVRMRVSGWGAGGNTKGVVEKGHCLWRTCGRRGMLREWKGFGRWGVEIFCSTWNILGSEGSEEDRGLGVGDGDGGLRDEFRG